MSNDQGNRKCASKTIVYAYNKQVKKEESVNATPQ